ncbi:hypothetical protein IW261DRAFT_1571585 [Armillaria novae-zelandiae]|uniref:Uncharacterized protein n=1 Tax=Armillaria novae-zelandiae TaxID=153914 RepID=A0AA39NUA1_9AGAR|nr:hypothetical protein IW261DRAFT_1571585 [Armillaria novae-zelandiae]
MSATLVAVHTAAGTQEDTSDAVFAVILLVIYSPACALSVSQASRTITSTQHATWVGVHSRAPSASDMIFELGWFDAHRDDWRHQHLQHSDIELDIPPHIPPLSATSLTLTIISTSSLLPSTMRTSIASTTFQTV